MPRTAREYVPGVPLHVIQRGNDRSALFGDVFDFDCFGSCLTNATRRHSVAVHAYVFMTNHIHLLVTPGSRESLGRAMHWCGTVFVQQINLRYGRTGSRFEGRYKTRLIQDERHFLSCMRYIEENPVRARMVASPGDYRNSSFRANAFGVDDGLVTHHPVYQRLGATPAETNARYRALFAEPLSEDEMRSIRMVSLRRGRRPNGDGPCNGVRP